MKQEKNNIFARISKIRFGILGILGVGAYIFPERLIVSIFLVGILMSVVDGLHYLVALRGISVAIHSEKYIKKNDIFYLRIEVTNKHFMPSPFMILQIKESSRVVPVKIRECIMLLGPREYFNEKIALKAQLSGTEKLPIEGVMSRSFLGFYKKLYPLKCAIQVNILPEVVSIENSRCFFELLRKKEEIHHTKQRRRKNIGCSEEEEVGYELKPYREGDNQRLIHWKLVAQKDMYLVRQREKHLAYKPHLFFLLYPLHPSHQEQEKLQDKTVITVVSMISACLHKGYTVKVLFYHHQWQCIQYEEIRQIGELQKILSEYSYIEKEEEETIEWQQLIRQLKGETGQIVMITACKDERVQEILRQKSAEQVLTLIVTSHHKTTFEKYVDEWEVQDNYRLNKIGENISGETESKE